METLGSRLFRESHLALLAQKLLVHSLQTPLSIVEGPGFLPVGLPIKDGPH